MRVMQIEGVVVLSVNVTDADTTSKQCRKNASSTVVGIKSMAPRDTADHSAQNGAHDQLG